MCKNHHIIPWSTIFEYKSQLGVHSDDTHIISLKALDNGIPSSPVPFITPSGLVMLQHDLKAHINSSPLVKIPLTMRPLVKKSSSIPFSLTLKRHSTIFTRPSSPSSSALALPGCTPASEMADPLSMAGDLPSEVPLHNTPSIGAKILDKFWPEDEESYSEESRRVSVPSRPTVSQLPPRTSSDNISSSPLQFPF
ncbi:hypothetical protein EV363DRAFT_1409893 [Boletus edulis]|nr:hypothetical protein EV363DRAFT_1409893 [Boletus edulis]